MHWLYSRTPTGGANLYSRVMVVGIMAALAAAMCLTGCGGGGGDDVAVNPPSSNPPVFTVARAELPDGFSYPGGTVTLKAVLTSDNGVSTVKATISGPTVDGAPTADYETFEKTLKKMTTGYYSTTQLVAANTRSDGKSEVYTVSFVATDTRGLTTTAPDVFITVPGASVPPPPPL